jgi:hypothetical protein
LSSANVDTRDFEQRRMAAFQDLSDAGRRKAILEMARGGASLDSIASATLLSVEAVAAVLAEPEAGHAA